MAMSYSSQESYRSHRSGKTAVTAQSFFTVIVHRAASRILIGEELCRDDVFIKMTTDFVMSIFITGVIIVKLPVGWLRDWLAYPLSMWHRNKLARCARMLFPVVRKRITEWNSREGSNGRLDAIEWSLMLAAEPSSVDAERLTTELIHNLWAGTSAPGGLVTEIMFQLLLEPQYRKPLIKEAQEALEPDGQWSEKALGRLPLLDSFIREVNRLYPTGSRKPPQIPEEFRRWCAPLN